MSTQSNATAEQVAQWMLDELKHADSLYQQQAVYDIEAKFGEEFFRLNESGNPAIAPKVLSAFRKLTGDTVVWERGERCWRMRQQYDEEGRRQN